MMMKRGRRKREPDVVPHSTRLTAEQILGLIHAGLLLPADSITKEGMPLWSFSNFAASLGLTELELAEVLPKKHDQRCLRHGMAHSLNLVQ